jgi:beta-lactamase class A
LTKVNNHKSVNIKNVHGPDYSQTRREWLLRASALIPIVLTRGTLPYRPTPTENPAEALAAIESHLGGRVGVAALDTATGQHLEHRDSERFPMCSTFKFLLVAAILARVDHHTEKLDRVISYSKDDLLEWAPITKAHLAQGGMTVSALCAAAIQYSDNTAANLLLAAIGGPPALTQYARSLGDSLTRLDRNEPSLNSAISGDPRDTTTPAAMLGDMKTLLVDPGALLPDSQKLLQDWLIGNTTGTQALRAGFPSTWRVGDKTGHGQNGSVNDIAIAWPPNRKPILVTAYLVESTAPDADHSAALSSIGRVVAASFN